MSTPSPGAARATESRGTRPEPGLCTVPVHCPSVPQHREPWALPSQPVSFTPPRALHLAPRSLCLRPSLHPTPHPAPFPAPCTSHHAPRPAASSCPGPGPAGHRGHPGAVSTPVPVPEPPALCPAPCPAPALPTSTHWPWDCMSSRTQGSDLLRVSRSRRCLQLTRSSTLERTASGAWEDGSGASPMVAAARGAARRDGGQAAPWVKGMRGDGAAAAFLAVSAPGWCPSCPGHGAPRCQAWGWSPGAGSWWWRALAGAGGAHGAGAQEGTGVRWPGRCWGPEGPSPRRGG